MEVLSFKFLFGFLMSSITLWIIFIFASRLLVWIISRIMGISIGFRVGGWNSLRNIVVKFKKGSIESVSVGEIKLTLRLSSVKLVFKDPKLQLFICELEVVTRTSSSKKSSQKSKTRKPRTSGQKKLMTMANVARFLSVSLADVVVKTPKGTLEFKEFKVDLSKNGGPETNMMFKLHILPILVHLGNPRVRADQSINLNEGRNVSYVQASFRMMERSSVPLFCEEFSFSCEFGYIREAGLTIQNVDVNFGEVIVSLDEELVSKKKQSDSSNTDKVMETTVDSAEVKKTHKKQALGVTLTKYASMFPEKVCFNLPKLDVRFVHQEHGLFAESSIMGMHVGSNKSRSTEDVGESTRLDVQIDFSGIHLLRESGTSVLDIIELGVISSFHIPIQPTSPIRAEVDVKLGGLQCNIIMSRFKPWLRLHSSKKKRMVLREEASTREKPQSTEQKTITWKTTVSVPEITIVIYSISDSPLYHGCLQSLHVSANNISSMAPTLHVDFGELNLRLADEYQECLKETLFGVESNSGSLVHVAKVSLDHGKKDTESREDNAHSSKLALSVDVTGMGVCLSYKRVESIIVTAMSFKALIKSFLTSGKKTSHSRGGRPSKPSGKGAQLIKFSLDQCSVNYCGYMSLDNTVITDPKRVNYGSQGGRVIISVSADGTPRSAKIMSAISEENTKLNYSISLEIFHFSVCINKEKQSTQVELETARSIYQEYLEDHIPCTKMTLFDVQNIKFVRRSGGLKEVAICSLFSATDITLRWEPDVHLSLIELVLQLKLLVHNQKLQELHTEDVSGAKDAEQKKESMVESSTADKHKKKESVFAVDVEMLSISAEAGDGVEAVVQVQSIFSENAGIGILLEGFTLGFNGSRVLKSGRMQISRIPRASPSSIDANISTAITWDFVIQGLDLHICLPFRLELRAIDDSIEEQLRGLKLISAAKNKLFFPMKKESSKPKKPSSMKFGSIKFYIRKLTAEIEEEPLQGWLDEHYQLLKKQARELAVRLKYLDELISNNEQCPKTSETVDLTNDIKAPHVGTETDAQDPSAILKMKEDIYKQTFRSYYQACQSLVPSDGSGAYREGFQSGFKPTAARTSLLSISATNFEITLTQIAGGDAGMIEFLRERDPICGENNIPFSRLYGSNILLNTATLVVQLRDYTSPLFSATCGKCQGRIVLAQQATCFQPQITHEIFVGKWRKVSMLRSATGTTPPMKTYSDLPLYFQKGEVCFGVGFEPPFADISYAFTVALRRANFSSRSAGVPQPPKKEKSLPWWDDMRNYIHGNINLFFSETKWSILGTTDPYEKLDDLQLTTSTMEIKQSDGRIYVSAKDFKIVLSSLESLLRKRGIKVPTGMSSVAFLEVPLFTLEVTIDWGCESGNPMNHYLFALPFEGKPREKVFDPFRSTALSLCFSFSLSNENLNQSIPVGGTVHGSECKPENISIASTGLNFAAHDLEWLVNFCKIMYLPPHKLRLFSRFPRFGVPRIVRSGNLSMDRVMTEFMLRLDATPTCIKHIPMETDDPAKGLTFSTTKLKFEICFSRGKQDFTFECIRNPLDLVYQGVDVHLPKVFLNREDCLSVSRVLQMTTKSSQSASLDKGTNEKGNSVSGCTEKHCDDGFMLSSDYFTVRKQSPKADPERLLSWQEAGKGNLETKNVRPDSKNGGANEERTQSDPSDDDENNMAIADSCQRVSVCGLKLLWNIENRDAVMSCIGGISKAVAPPKPSPSRRYAQRKLHEETKNCDEPEVTQNDSSKSPTSEVLSSHSQNVETAEANSSLLHSVEVDDSLSATVVNDAITNDSEEDDTRHFMVNVIEPQFNLHSEEANGRFLLAAVSGRVLARSFHSVLRVGQEVIEQALGTEKAQIPEGEPEMTWKRTELSVMLEHVQAHVAPTDVDPGAGVQWLKILKSSPKVKRTGALLERVFMPCDMYFRLTRHKGGTPELKVKPLKEVTFNSHNITATMTSRQFQVMLDVLTNLLFARLPKPRKKSLPYPEDDDEDVEEEADEVVPDGVEEVELARVNLEQKQRESNMLLDDIKKLSVYCDASGDQHLEMDGNSWMVTGEVSVLVQGLKRDLVNAKKCRKEAFGSLRTAMQKAAQQRLMEKEKTKSPSYAMHISLLINQIVWSMLLDGKSFAEVEINDMIYDFDRDYKDIGVSLLTTKYIVVRNCLPNAKSDTLLSAWNPPAEWGKKVMVRVDTKQGAPKDGNSSVELFNVEIYPLRIHLTESMYRMMWVYFFPEEEQDSQRRQEVWKVSTTAGLKRAKKGSSINDVSGNQSTKDSDVSSKSSSAVLAENAQGSKLQNVKPNELRRTSSFDRSWEETVAESVANELVLQAHTSGVSSSKSGASEQRDESSKGKLKESNKPAKAGRSAQDEKKVVKSQEEKRPGKMMEFHNIKISQVELLVSYEGSRFVVSDLKLLMDTFHRVEFTGTWKRLFSRVKKHIIWGVLKSVTGMQGKKFKDKSHNQPKLPDHDPNLIEADPADPIFNKRPVDGAGDGFVTSVKGLFSTQRRKAKQFVLRTMRNDGENDYQGEWSESDAEFSPLARQLTVNKAKKLIRRHTKKYKSRGQKGSSSQQIEALPVSPMEIPPFDSDSSSGSSPLEDFQE